MLSSRRGKNMVGLVPKPVWQSVCGDLRRPRRSTTLLIIVVAGLIDIALLSSFAMGPQVNTEVAAPSKLQHRLAAVASNTTRPIQIFNSPEFQSSSKPSTPQTDLLRQRDAALSPPLDLRSESVPQPEPIRDPVSDLLSGNAGPQTAASPQSDTVPLPTRKPETPTPRRPPTKKASLKRTLKRHVEEEPRPPLPFGNFGYNYVGQ